MGWPARIARMLRHRLQQDAHRAIPRDALARLTQRVAASEQRHTGQIRVCVEGGLPNGYIVRDATPRQRAVVMFGKLGVWDTAHNNGVLVYLLLAERAIEIVADRGLASRVPADEWQRIVRSMGDAFQADRYEEGLNAAVDAASALLERHFPRRAGEESPNELPDEPVLG